MHTPPRILVVDDQPMNVDILKTRLDVQSYEVLTATSGQEALEMATSLLPDLILLDIIMPVIDGMEVCRRLKDNPALPFMPIVMITARSETHDIVAGLEAGADAYLSKPLDQAALMARIKSMLRMKALYDTAKHQAIQLEFQAAELESWNQVLEKQVLKQMSDLQRMGRLKQFMSPQLAEWVVSSDDEELFKPQKRDVTVVCCALQGFTTFVELHEPDTVFEVLRGYHQTTGPLIARFDGTLERFGEGMLQIVFNAPLLCTDPVFRAVHMAVSMHQLLNQLRTAWQTRGYALDFGIGIAHGLMTLGMVSWEGRVDYALLGSAREQASRLCSAAQGGQILVSPSVREVVKDSVETYPAGECTLNDETNPVPVFAVDADLSREG